MMWGSSPAGREEKINEWTKMFLVCPVLYSLSEYMIVIYDNGFLYYNL